MRAKPKNAVERMNQAERIGETIKWLDEQNPMHWIWKPVVTLGIDVRQSGQHARMRYYLDLLRDEIRMTEEFLSRDGDKPTTPP